jgi:hypothetical protein
LALFLLSSINGNKLMGVYMKKLVLTVVTASMLVSSAFADGGSHDYHAPFKLRDFFCALAGGATGGVIGAKAVGGFVPSFLGAILGGAIGVNFCKYLDSSASTAQLAAYEGGLDKNLCEESSWNTDDYHGKLRILAESSAINGGYGELSTENTCKQFHTTIISNSTGRKVGETTVWACKTSEQNLKAQWIVTQENWINKRDIRRCNQPIQVQPPTEVCAGGSVSVGNGRVPLPAPIPVGLGPVGSPVGRIMWGVESLRRKVNDYGVTRGMLLAHRVPYDWSDRVEVGFFEALSDDGLGVVMYLSPEKQIVVPLSEVGIECRGTSNICPDIEVTTGVYGDFVPLKGTLDYVFQNGDVVVNDRYQGIRRRPGIAVNTFLYTQEKR